MLLSLVAFVQWAPRQRRGRPGRRSLGLMLGRAATGRRPRAAERLRHAHGVQHDAVLRVHAVLGLVKDDGVGCGVWWCAAGRKGRDG